MCIKDSYNIDNVDQSSAPFEDNFEIQQQPTEASIPSDHLIDVNPCDICMSDICICGSVKREENREQSPELGDAGSQSGRRGRTRRGRSPKVTSDDEDFMPTASSTRIMSRPASRTRSKTAAKSSQRSRSRKSTQSRQRASSKKPAASRSRSRSKSTGRKPASRGRGRK